MSWYCEGSLLGRRQPLLYADALIVGLSVSARASVVEGLAIAAIFRAALVVHALFNEWGHVLVGLALGAGRRAFNVPNLLGNRPLITHVRALVPFSCHDRGDLTVSMSGLSADETKRIREGGFWLAA